MSLTTRADKQNRIDEILSNPVQSAAEIAKLRVDLAAVTKQRDDLLEALDQVSATRNIGSAHIIARAAIASVKGGS